MALLDQPLAMDQGCDWGGLDDPGSRINWATKATPSSAAVNVDFTGYSAVMKVRPLPGGTAILSLTSGAGITLGDGTGDYNIQIDVTDTQTAAMPAGTHGFDLLLTDASGIVKKFLTGSCVVKPTYSVA